MRGAEGSVGDVSGAGGAMNIHRDDRRKTVCDRRAAVVSEKTAVPGSCAPAPLGATLSGLPEWKPSGIPVAVVYDHGAVVSTSLPSRLSLDGFPAPPVMEQQGILGQSQSDQVPTKGLNRILQLEGIHRKLLLNALLTHNSQREHWKSDLKGISPQVAKIFQQSEVHEARSI